RRRKGCDECSAVAANDSLGNTDRLGGTTIDSIEELNGASRCGRVSGCQCTGEKSRKAGHIPCAYSRRIHLEIYRRDSLRHLPCYWRATRSSVVAIAAVHGIDPLRSYRVPLNDSGCASSRERQLTADLSVVGKE